MKKIFCSIFFVLCSHWGFTQNFIFIRSFKSNLIGLKGGVNLAKFDVQNIFSSDNRIGYHWGFWLRREVARVYFQPELYLSGINTVLKNNTGNENKVKFTSLDVLFLMGKKIGGRNIGLRLDTGPLFSFILSQEQKFSQAVSNVFDGHFKGQNLAWKFGIGVDILYGISSIDLRYQVGLSNLNNAGYPETKLNMFTLGLGFRYFF